MRGLGLLQKLKEFPGKLSHGRQASSSSSSSSSSASPAQIPAPRTSNARRRRDSAETISDHRSSPSPIELSATPSVSGSSSANRSVKVRSGRIPDAVDATADAIATAKSVATARKKDDRKLDSVISSDVGRTVSSSSNEDRYDDDDDDDRNDDAKAVACTDSKESSKQNAVEESKKNMYQVAFPVSVFIEWWITCFMNNTGHVTDLAFPLGKIHVWVSAYQRVHMEVAGQHADGQAIAALIRKLHVLQAVVMRGSFRWSDTKHIHVHSPLEEDTGDGDHHAKSAAFQDELVQEVLLLVLEPIFEARFSARSHAHRPGRDVHSALNHVRSSLASCTWFIKGSAGILEEEIYVPRIVECVVRVVRDPRVSALLKTALLGGEVPAKLRQDGRDRPQMVSNWGSCRRLKNFLCNVYLDKLDQWMEDQILSSRRSRTSSSSEVDNKPCKLEYVRYGTDFLVGCKGSQEEAEDIQKKLCSFFKQSYRMDYSKEWTVRHISDGVDFLNHVISQRVVHPVVSRRNLISGSKRGSARRSLGISLSIKASRASCCLYLKDMAPPTSIENIVDVLTILYNWYYLADDRDRAIEYCKFYLCSAYAMSMLSSVEEKVEEDDDEYLSRFREAMKLLEEKKLSSHVLDRSGWVTEHEKVLRNLAWLRDEKAMDEVKLGFHAAEKASPQQCMGQVVWQFLHGRYPVKGGYSYSLDHAEIDSIQDIAEPRERRVCGGCGSMSD